MRIQYNCYARRDQARFSDVRIEEFLMASGPARYSVHFLDSKNNRVGPGAFQFVDGQNRKWDFTNLLTGPNPFSELSEKLFLVSQYEDEVARNRALQGLAGAINEGLRTYLQAFLESWRKENDRKVFKMGDQSLTGKAFWQVIQTIHDGLKGKTAKDWLAQNDFEEGETNFQRQRQKLTLSFN